MVGIIGIVLAKHYAVMVRGMPMNRTMKLNTLCLLVLIALDGCGQVTVFGHALKKDHEPAVEAPPPPASPATPASSGATAGVPVNVAARPAAPMVKSLALRLTPEAEKKADDEEGFSVDNLRMTVEREFKSRRLLDAQNPRASGTVVILVDEFETHFTSNVKVFGHTFSAGKMAGSISVRNSDGKEIQSLKVAAESKLPLADLYFRFAQIAADQYIAGPASTP
jgi:hypothetical protein